MLVKLQCVTQHFRLHPRHKLELEQLKLKLKQYESARNGVNIHIIHLYVNMLGAFQCVCSIDHAT